MSVPVENLAFSSVSTTLLFPSSLSFGDRCSLLVLVFLKLNRKNTMGMEDIGTSLNQIDSKGDEFPQVDMCSGIVVMNNRIETQVR